MYKNLPGENLQKQVALGYGMDKEKPGIDEESKSI